MSERTKTPPSACTCATQQLQSFRTNPYHPYRWPCTTSSQRREKQA